MVDMRMLFHNGKRKEKSSNIWYDPTTPPSETRPNRCRRPLPLLACWKDSCIFSTLFNSPFFKV